MTQIRVIDARMGRGKSSAAIRYMNEHKDEERFLYITPILTEVDRICEACDFDQPDSDHLTKSAELKRHLRRGDNVAASHSLFYLMDEEARELVREKGYHLFIDESISVIERKNVTAHDRHLILETLTTHGEDGSVHWIDERYSGKFDDYKEMADSGHLYILDAALIEILNPETLRCFRRVTALTYLFTGSTMEAYFKYYGFDYTVSGVDRDERGFYFTDSPDAPPPIDYTKYIHIVDGKKMNGVGEPYYALSKGWYEKHSADHDDIKKLRNGMDNFFRNMKQSDSKSRLWTCFKGDIDKLSGGRYRRSFLNIGAKATNQYASVTNLAYMVNRFADPNIKKFFGERDIEIDPKNFALSEMLQWIWRSAIRNGKPINLYIPSRRMREYLLSWMDEMKTGGERNAS